MNNSSKILSSQRRLFAALVVGSIVLFGSILYWAFSEDNYSPVIVNKNVDLPGDKVDPQEIWMNKLETEHKLTEQKIKYLETIVLDSKEREKDSEQENLDLRTEVSNLKSELRKAVAPIGKEVNAAATDDPFIAPSQQHAGPMKLEFHEFVMEKGIRQVSHVDLAIPSGTSVKTVLISSVDSICGVYASSDPIPVKLRVLDDAHLPKNVRAKLKGAIIIASAYGNISSERVYMRLERLTQVNPDGEFVETVVTGYVTGEDGKYGVRGTVVDKSGKIITNAAYSGFCAGVGEILQSAVRRNGYNENNFALNADLIKQGAIGGTSTAFDMLAEYYIRRAEQVQPVIQVNAGRIVDVTFTHQADLGDINTQQKMKQIREDHA